MINLELGAWQPAQIAIHIAIDGSRFDPGDDYGFAEVFSSHFALLSSQSALRSLKDVS